MTAMTSHVLGQWLYVPSVLSYTVLWLVDTHSKGLVLLISITMVTGSFPGIKWVGCGVHHPPSSSAKFKERVEIYIYTPSGPSRPVPGLNLTYAILQHNQRIYYSAPRHTSQIPKCTTFTRISMNTLYSTAALSSWSLSCIINFCLTSSVLMRNSHLKNSTAIFTESDLI